MTPRQDEAAFESVRSLFEHIHPGKSADGIYRSLKSSFGSANAMFSASPHLLKSTGLSDDDALLIGSMNDLCRYADRTDYTTSKPVMNTLQAAAVYLVDSLRSLSEERFCMLCLDPRGRLIADIILQDGTDDTALFSLKELLAQIVRVRPYAVILSHNHPRHTLRPSSADIDCTREALRALSVLGIPMLDHIIVAGRQAVSIRDNGFLPAELWLNQSCDCVLLREWLDTSKKPTRK